MSRFFLPFLIFCLLYLFVSRTNCVDSRPEGEQLQNDSEEEEAEIQHAICWKMLGRTDKLLQDTRIRRNSNATALQQVPPQFLRSAPRLMPAQSHTLPNAMVTSNV
jgi:hypothetical protein